MKTRQPPGEDPVTRASLPTLAAVPVRETQRAFAAVRVPVERRLLTVISGPQAGLVLLLHHETHTLGRGETADLRVDDADVSRHHATFRRESDGNYSVEDTSSTNGTFLGTERVQRARLKPGDRLQCGTTLVLRYSVSDDIEQELHERLHASATRDFLTRVHNRAYFLERLHAEMAHARRHHAPMALLLLDLDRFARVNDTDGLEAGDVLLRAVAGRLQRLVRVEDVLSRYGGDEFAVLARSSSLASGARLADRLRVAVRDIRLPDAGDGEGPAITLSVGVAALSELPASADAGALRTLAEGRLAGAKRLGRDRVCAADA